MPAQDQKSTWFSPVGRRRDMHEVLRLLNLINDKVTAMAVSIDDIGNDVTSLKAVVDAAVTLIQTLQATIAGGATDQAKLQAVDDALKAMVTELTSAGIVPPAAPAPAP